MKYLAIVLLLCGAAFAQNAEVVELSGSDAAQAKALYNAKIAADKAWDDLNADMAKRHGSTFIASGFFEFSKDFRFVVPKTSNVTTATTLGYWPSVCRALTVNPASGIAPTPYATFDSPSTITSTSNGWSIITQ